MTTNIKDLADLKSQKLASLVAVKTDVLAKTKELNELKKKLSSVMSENDQINRELQSLVKDLVKSDQPPISISNFFNKSNLVLVWAVAVSVILGWQTLSGNFHIPLPPGPAPIPGPVNPPKPLPVPIVPATEKLFFTIIYDDNEMNSDTAAVVRSQSLRDYLKSANINFFTYELHSKDLAGKGYDKVIQESGTPAVILQREKGEKLASDKLQKNVEDVIKFVKEKSGRG